jgi:CRISPR-associated protein Cas2
MSMTVVVTRSVSNRTRGFLASAMLEVAPGVYTGPRISSAVRERIWSVLTDWFAFDDDASVVMVWQTTENAAGQAVRVLGVPPVDFAELDGIVLTRRDVGDAVHA